MKLMQELLTAQPGHIETLDESISTVGDIARYKRIFNIIDNELEHLGAVLKKDSNFAKLSEKLGGDASHLNDAIEAYSKLYDSLQDLHMSVGLSNDDNWDKA